MSARRRASITGLSLLALLSAGSLGVLAPGAAQADPAPAAAVVTLDNLQTNGRTDPLGIPGGAPSLSWHAASAGRGVVQTAYQVRVATSAAALSSGDLVWDSQEVAGDRQVDVAYGGPALTSQTRYVWQVRTWDGGADPTSWSTPASFETGLLAPSDWKGQWIARDAGSDLAAWSDYTTTVDFHLDALAFGVFFRGATTNDAYMYQLTVADGTPRLKVHTRTGGAYAVVENKDISGSISAAALLAGDHTLAITADGSTITTTLDGTQVDQRQDSKFAHGYVGLRTSQATEGAESVTVHDLEVTATSGGTLLDAGFDGTANPLSAGTVSGGDLHLSGNADAWYAPDHPLPLLRDAFATEAGKTVASARVYASARGVYQLSIDGKPVGDQHLAPGSTTYSDRIQSQTYDVTSLLTSGDHVIGAELGAGWYAGRDASLAPGYWGGTDPSLIAQLRIDYTDGTSQTVATDPTWTTHTGPFLLADNIDGETYDARRAQPGFDTTGFDASTWAPATVAPGAAAATGLLVAQPDEPVRTTQELPALSRTEKPAGSSIYDLGQNMVGVARVTLTGHAGDTVRIRYGEVLNPDGSLYTANLRSAKATDHYTFASDGTVTYTPTFTYHGFRYVEITGASTPPAVSEVTGEVWGSDLDPAGTVQTSDPMLNQLASNISWGQRDNFLSVPTDTPARDERLGWLGDINVFAPTASYLVDDRAFMEKFTADMRDAQFPDGSLPGVAPYYTLTGGIGGTAWEDAMVTVPFAVWNAYGDTKLVQQNWDAMTAFMAHVQKSAGDDLVDTGRNVYGDWLTLESDTPAGVIGTAYYAEDARMMSQMAAAIGDTAAAATYADLSTRVAAAFAENFVQADGTVGNGTQTGYALALGMGLVPQGQVAAVGARYVAKIHASGDHLATGFVGTPWLLPALSRIGRNDLAYQLLQTKTYPSWGYEIANGATTTWERWNSIMPDGSFGDVSMNSFNHYAYGAVGDWMYQNIGGIAPAAPGYKKARIAPQPGGGLTSASGTFDSAYGRIASSWKQSGDDLTEHVEVPVNTTADVVLPAENRYAVSESGAALADAAGVTGVSEGDGTVTITVGSGSYDFTVTAGDAEIGAVLDRVDALAGHVDDLATRGDLSSADHDHLATALDGVTDDLTDVLAARLARDPAAATAGLRSAVAGTQALRSWLAASSVDAPVRGDLDGRAAPIEAVLVRLLTQALGVSVALPPVSGAVLPGATATGTLQVTTTGTAALEGLTGTVTVAGLDPVPVTLGALPAGTTGQVPVAVGVPAQHAPGALDATYELQVRIAGATYHLTGSTAGWLTVTSGLTIGAPSIAVGDGDPAEGATLSVPVTNTGTAPVRAGVAAALPTGWGSVPSDETLLPAGATTSVAVPVVVPLDRVGGAVPMTLTLTRAGATLASSEASVDVPLAVPPTATVIDHVDFGDATSENAHAIMASPSSGTSNEAGVSRRYANANNPGSWYSVQLKVPDGQPFLLRGLETFDGAHTKKYDVYVNDELVHTQLVPRAESGEGLKTYDAVISDPSLATDGGSVRVKFEYPTDASGFYDPSLADVWVMALPADHQAPVASAAVASGTPGDAGWYRSPVSVAVTAADNDTTAPVVETGTDAGWQPYVGAVPVSGDGKHALSYRATDAAGNTTGARTLPVWIDATAPTTTAAVAAVAGRSDAATVSLTATDATSGVATTAYRVDGGGWKIATGPVSVTGYGAHQVEFASTDAAGNVEAVRTTSVTLADVDQLTALAPPQLSGQPRIGQLLSATDAAWNTSGTTQTRQWLRNGQPIAGATGATYRLGVSDLGARLSVRVTATKGATTGTSDSAATAPVTAATSVTTVELDRTAVRRGARVRVAVSVTADGVAAADVAGKVRVVVDGTTARKAKVKEGKATVAVRLRNRGHHTVSVSYLGTVTVAGSRSPSRSVTTR